MSRRTGGHAAACRKYGDTILKSVRTTCEWCPRISGWGFSCRGGSQTLPPGGERARTPAHVLPAVRVCPCASVSLWLAGPTTLGRARGSVPLRVVWHLRLVQSQPPFTSRLREGHVPPLQLLPTATPVIAPSPSRRGTLPRARWCGGAEHPVWRRGGLPRPPAIH